MISDHLDQNSNQTDLGKMNHMIWMKKSAEKFIAFYQLIRTDTERTLEITELRSCINIGGIFANGEKLVKSDLFINALDKTQIRGKKHNFKRSFI